LKPFRTTPARLALVGLVLLLALTACQARPRTQDEVPRMAPSVLKDRLDAGDDVLVVDARSASSYAAQHISGAISIPLDELPRGETIIFY
jgi:3-mercaptopyruvate sulfurtransferase SseA